MFGNLFGKSEPVAPPERELLHAIIANLQDAIITHDSNFKILVFNAAAEWLFHIPAKDVLGQVITLERATKEPIFHLLGQALFPSLASVIMKRSEPGTFPQVVEIILENPFRQYLITTSQLSSSGAVNGLIKVIHDRTREVEMLKSKNEFITVASHQLRTPLTAIEWTFQELQSAQLPNPEIKELVQTGDLAAQKLSKIVNDFLDIAKLEEGRFGYKFEMRDLTDFISRIVGEAVPIAKEYGVKVYFENPGEAIQAPMDAAKLGIVFSNLIDNAIKYNVESGEVAIRLKRIPGQQSVEITIQDTGVGITEDEMKKLFTKFFRTEEAVKRDSTGSGLGLYLVKNIVEQHGGKISATSVIGRGTTFTFTLPTDLSLVPQTEVPIEQ